MVHHLLKSEHLVVVIAVRIGVVRVGMMGVEELDDVEAFRTPRWHRIEKPPDYRG